MRKVIQLCRLERNGEEWREGEGEGEGENAQCKREVVQPGGGSIATYFKHLYM